MLFTAQNIGGQPFDPQILAPDREHIREQIVEYVTNDQHTQNIRKKVDASEEIPRFDSGIQPHGNQQTEDVDQDGYHDREFECEPIRIAHVTVLEQIDIILESDEIEVIAESIPVREGVIHPCKAGSVRNTKNSTTAGTVIK